MADIGIRIVGTDAVTPVLQKIEQGTKQLGATMQSVGKTDPFQYSALSAKQLAFNLRGIPAQFTDIAVSLQSGQAPLTVFLQQGGQLKDMFGGIGPAAKAMGGYLLGLVNPFTVTAAAVGVLGYAWYKGAQEAGEYNKALILSGNTAGATASQMQASARNIAASSNASTGAAADAVAQFVRNGDIAASKIESFAATAVSMQQLTGSAVAETVKQFAELGKDPVAASLKLNETTGYLTASVYEQIKSLVDQGRTLEAGALAQQAYGDAMNSRMPQLKENLGAIEKAWAGIAWAVKGAQDVMLNIGRTNLDGEKLEAIKKRITNAEKPFDPSAFGGNAEDRAQLPMLRAQADALERLALQSQSAAKAAAAHNEQSKASFALSKEADQYASKQVQMQRAIAKAQENFDNSGKSASDLANYTQAVVGIQDKFKEAKKAKEAITDAAKGLALYNDLMAVSTGLSANFAEKQGLLAAKFGKDSNMEQYRAGLTALIAQQPYMVKSLKDEADALTEIGKARNDALKAHGTELASLGEKAQKIEDEVALYGLSKAAIEELTTARMLDRIEVLKSFDNSAEEIARIQETIAARQRLASAETELDTKDLVAKSAKKAAAEWKKTADSINNTLTDALMRAFEGGASFARAMRDTILNMFKTMILRPVISAVMNPVSQAIGGSLGLNGAAAAQGTGGNLLGTAASLSGLYDSIAGGFTKVSSGASSAFGALARSSIGQSMGMSSGEAMVGNNVSAYVAPEMTSGSLAASSAIGTAAGYAAGAAAGLAIGNAISGEFGSSNTVLAGTIIGSIVGGPIGGAIGGAIGGLVNRAFGMGNTELTKQGTRGTFDSAGFAGTNYANYHKEGGWFRSDKNWTDTSAVDPKTVKSWSASFAGMQTAVAGTASSVGLATDKIYAYSKAVDIAAGSTAEQVAALFTGMADDMARASAPSIANFAKEGETASATLQRLSTSITTANAWLHLLQNRLFNVSMSGADAASKLADAFGGLDNLAASSKAYYEAYYTEAERTTASSRDLAKAMALVNVTLPASKNAFRDVVSSLDLTSEAGRNAYAVLLALAPEYAATSDAIARLASESAARLMRAFTGNGQLLPALDATQLAIGDFTGATSVMGGELSFINSIMGDSTSAVIGFSNGAYIMGTSLSASQLSAGLLNDQIVALQGNADKARIDFAGLAEALATVNTETFVATLALVFENLATRISGVIGDIGTERIAVREAALQIINPTVMGKAQIQSGIAGINVSLPSNAGVVSANARLNYAEQNQAWQKSYSASTVAAYQGALDSAKKTAADLPATYKAKYAEWVALQQKYGNVFANEKWNEGQTRTAFQYNESTNRLKGYGANYSTWGSWGWSDVNGFNNDPKRAALQGDLQNANYNLEQSEKNVVSWAQSLASVTQQQAALATSAASATAAAQAAAKKAVLDYAAAMQNFVIDASKSVGKLSKLREETVKYYEAQKALADLMSTSAAGLRSTVETYRYNQKTPEQQLADLQGKYSTAYSTAMAVQGNGEALAGQGDKLNALLQPLIEKLNETGNSNLVNSYLAQAETVAKMIEAAIPVNYQADSLSMLGSIDATLAALDASSQSAEKIIADAIKAGSDKTAAGLHAVIAALSGQAIPAFATGGSYAGGLALVGERGPEVINFDQPGQVYNAAQTRGMFAGGNNMARLEALVERQGKQLEAMSYELRAIAGSTNKTARSLDQALGEGDGALAVKVIA